MNIAKRPDNVFVSGHGSWLIDSDGRRFLDFIQGWAVNCLGHTPEPLVRAISDQARELINCSPAFYNEPMVRLADALTASSGMDEVFFANSGLRPTKEQSNSPASGDSSIATGRMRS